jgi:Epoxide hydrolase N terminus
VENPTGSAIIKHWAEEYQEAAQLVIDAYGEPQEALAGHYGKEEPPMPVRPFTVHVPDATLADLRERLGRTRWQGELDGSGWQDGTSPAFMRELPGCWRAAGRWRCSA